MPGPTIRAGWRASTTPTPTATCCTRRFPARPQPLTGARLHGRLLRYPWMTLGVVARIHWQALRLWLKRVPFFSKPQPPLEETTR
jgi:DUF1365 family protein